MNSINILTLVFHLSALLTSIYLQINQGGFYFLIMFLYSFTVILSMISVSLDLEESEQSNGGIDDE